MKRLLAIEWLKLKHYKAFKLLLAFFTAGIFLSNYIVYATTESMEKNMKDVAKMAGFTPYDFSQTWQTTSYVSGWLLLLPAMIIIMLCTNEYSYKTSRQNIIDGLSREEFILSKLSLAIILALYSFLLAAISALIFGAISGTSFSTEHIEQIGFFFLKALSYNLFAILISVLVKKTEFAIGLFFIYLGAENILSQFLNVWSIKLRADYGKDFGYMGDYLPMNAADGLLKFPENNITSMAKSVMPTDYFTIVLVMAFVYIVLFAFWGRKKFLKADL